MSHDESVFGGARRARVEKLEDALKPHEDDLFPRIGFALFLVRAVQKEIPDSDRLALWSAIQEGYCKHCGRVVPPGDQCHCWNDE